MSIPRPMVKDALISAYAGESMAHIRYLYFADVAEKEGFKNVARLFRAVAYSERIHASNHFRRLSGLDSDEKVSSGAPFGPGNTIKNLELAIRGEEFEINEMYPTYIQIAHFHKDMATEMTFRYALEAEKIHAELFKEAKKYVEKGQDLPLDGKKIWICPICGYTFVGEEPPEKCPICGAPKDMFKSF